MNDTTPSMASRTIKINGQTYELDKLNPTAKTMLGNLRTAERKLAELKQEIALVTVARDTFGKTLLDNLPPPSDAATADDTAPPVTLN